MTLFHQPKKRFGQNFLCNNAIIQKIIANLNLQPTDHVVEIGPGLGAITEQILPHVAKLDAIELDRDLISTLQQKFSKFNNFYLHQADILKFDLISILSTQPNIKLRVIGNLPYNISTPLLFKLFEFHAQHKCIIDMYFMLQKEVALRLTALPNCKDYGRLTIMAQYHCKIDRLFDVAPTCFQPAPKVNSSFVRFVPQLPELQALDLNLLNQITTTAFNQRRKIIQNSLQKYFSEADFIAMDINPKARPEQLTVTDFVNLSNKLIADGGYTAK